MTKSDLFTVVMDKLWSLGSESSKGKMLELLRLIGDVDNGHALVSFQVLLSCLRYNSFYGAACLLDTCVSY